MKKWNTGLQQAVTYVVKNLIEKIKNFRKVNNHCHFKEKYRGAANLICNLK